MIRLEVKPPTDMRDVYFERASQRVLGPADANKSDLPILATTSHLCVTQIEGLESEHFIANAAILAIGQVTQVASVSAGKLAGIPAASIKSESV